MKLKFQSVPWFLLAGLILLAGCGASSSGGDVSTTDQAGGQSQLQIGVVIKPTSLDNPRSATIIKDHLYVLQRNQLSVFNLKPLETSKSGDAVVLALDFRSNVIDANTTSDHTVKLSGTDMFGSETIASTGNTIYLGGFNLSVLDNSSADTLVNGPKTTLPYRAMKYLRIFGDYLLASGTTSEGGFLLDISDPADPVFLNGFATGLADVSTSVMHGGYIYTFDLNRTLHVYDASNPLVDIPKVAEYTTRIAVSNALIVNDYLIVTGTKPGDPNYRRLDPLSQAYDDARPRTSLIIYSLADPINPFDINYLALSGPVGSYGRGLGFFGDCIAVSKYGPPFGQGVLVRPTTSVELINVSNIVDDLAVTADLADSTEGTLKGASTTFQKSPYDIVMNDDYLFAGGDDYVLAMGNPCGKRTISEEALP